MHQAKKHFWYYASLIAILLLGLFLIVLNGQNKQMQMLTIVILAVAYLFWSLLHQYLHHRLHVKIVVESILIASLGIAVSLLLFNS
jgi:hypothetical protein